jgi:hypothetical protein
MAVGYRLQADQDGKAQKLWMAELVKSLFIFFTVTDY